MSKQWVFDMPHATRFVEARQGLLRDVLPDLRSQLALRTALDTGCGVGLFSGFLRDLGFRVVSFDGRAENVEEARARFSDIEFCTADIEDPSVQQLGSFDLVVCLGLLYHLENPFRAIRNLHALTERVLIVETMCAPTREPILFLSDEWHGEDQGLNFVAFYPSEQCLAKMLYRSGFPFVYRFARLPAHEDFQATFLRKRARTIFAASKTPLDFPFLARVQEPLNIVYPWITVWGRIWLFAKTRSNWITTMYHLIRRPWPEKLAILRRRLGS